MFDSFRGGKLLLISLFETRGGSARNAAGAVRLHVVRLTVVVVIVVARLGRVHVEAAGSRASLLVAAAVALVAAAAAVLAVATASVAAPVVAVALVPIAVHAAAVAVAAAEATAVVRVAVATLVLLLDVLRLRFLDVHVSAADVLLWLVAGLLGALLVLEDHETELATTVTRVVERQFNTCRRGKKSERLVHDFIWLFRRFDLCRTLPSEPVRLPTFDVAELREVVADLRFVYVRIKSANEDLLRLRSGLRFARIDLSVFDRVWSVC